MMPAEKKIWFPTKRYGYGWGLPCCWQGWVVFVGYIALILAAPQLVPQRHYTAYTVALSIVMIGIVIWKGGRPRWRWGK